MNCFSKNMRCFKNVFDVVDVSLNSVLIKEHNEIAEGLVSKDKRRVTAAMHLHVENQVHAVKEMIREQDEMHKD